MSENVGQRPRLHNFILPTVLAVFVIVLVLPLSVFAGDGTDLDEIERSEVSLTLWLSDPRWTIEQLNTWDDTWFAWGDSRFQYAKCEWRIVRAFGNGFAIMLAGCDPRVFMTLGPFGGDPAKDMHVSLLNEYWTLSFVIEEGVKHVRGGAPIQDIYSRCYTYTGDFNFELICTTPNSILGNRFNSKLDFLFVFPDGSNPLIGDFTDDLRGAVVAALDYFEHGIASSKLVVAQDGVDLGLGSKPNADRIHSWGDIKSKTRP